MLCPLMVMAKETSERSGFPRGYYCLQEKCAWWSKGLQQCSIVELAVGAHELWQAFDDLAREINQAVLRK